MSTKAFIALVMLAGVTIFAPPAFAADPTLHQVYQAVEAGKLTEAQGMIDQVLRDHPDSAKAHFVEAEILAREGRTDSAQAELNTAERLSPGLSFAKPQAVQSLKARIAGPHGALSHPGNGTPWGALLLGGLGLLAFIFFVARWMGRRNPIASSIGSGPQWSSAAPMQPVGAGPIGSTGSGIGSGILGGLATGAAVGAGIVAGEALMHRFTDGNHREPFDSGIAPANDAGGNDFGIADSSSWDDNTGGGSDDWS